MKTVEGLVDKQVSEDTSPPLTLSAEGEPERTSRKFSPTSDDFFDYINNIVTQDEWTTSSTCLYIYKQAASGNVQLERLYRPVTFDEMRDVFVPKYGPGNYLLQFNTRQKQLSQASKRMTFDGAGASLADGSTNAFGTNAYTQAQLPSALSKAIESTSKMLEEGAKAAVEVSKSGQIENNRPTVDLPALITAIGTLIPKPDHKVEQEKDKETNFLVTMLENQRKDADSRAERELKAANERAERELRAANERAERDSKFFQIMLDQQQKFSDALLKEKDKSGSFGMAEIGKVVGEMFKAFAEDRLEGDGRMLPGWAGVAQAVIPKILDAAQSYAPLIAARLSGQQLSSQQIQQIQQQQQQNPTAPQLLPPQPINGGQQLGFPSTEQLLIDLLNRIGLYVTSHEPSKLNIDSDQDGISDAAGYFLDVIEQEYSPVGSLWYQLPKEQILQTLTAYPVGQQLLQHEPAKLFIESLINAIKNQEEGTDDGQSGVSIDQEDTSSKKRGRPKAH